MDTTDPTEPTAAAFDELATALRGRAAARLGVARARVALHSFRALDRTTGAVLGFSALVLVDGHERCAVHFQPTRAASYAALDARLAAPEDA